MAGDSLANTLSFLASQVTGNREIPAASPEFLASARNPNIRNFGPGQQPEFQNPMLALLMGGAGQNAGKGDGGLALSGAIQPQTTPPQGNKGALSGILRMLGLDNLSRVSDPLLGRKAKIEEILNQAN